MARAASDKFFTATGTNYAKVHSRTRYAAGGDVDVLARYWTDIHADSVQGLVATLDAAAAADTVAVGSQTFTARGKWRVAYVESVPQNNGAYTIIQVFIDSRIHDVSSPSNGVCVFKQAAVGRNQAMQITEFRRISDADADAIMENPGDYDGGELTYTRAKRMQYEDGTNDVEVTGTTPLNSYTIRFGEPDNISYSFDEVWIQKKPNPDAADGYEWRVITTAKSVKYDNSHTTVQSHVSGGKSGTFMKYVGNDRYMGVKVTSHTVGEWNTTAWDGS